MPTTTAEPTRQDELDEAMVQRIVDGGPRPRKPTFAECEEACRRLLARGVSTYDIEHTHGLKPERYFKVGQA